MKVPQIILVDAGLVFTKDTLAVEPSLLALIDMCADARIPLYLTGTGLECTRVPHNIVERVCDVHRIKHATSALWYHLEKKHEVRDVGHMLYVSPHEERCAVAQKHGMTPVPIDGATTGHIHKQGSFEDLAAFVHALDMALKGVARTSASMEEVCHGVAH